MGDGDSFPDDASAVTARGFISPSRPLGGRDRDRSTTITARPQHRLNIDGDVGSPPMPPLILGGDLLGRIEPTAVTLLVLLISACLMVITTTIIADNPLLVHISSTGERQSSDRDLNLLEQPSR
jgi:hypothetical protein